MIPKQWSKKILWIVFLVYAATICYAVIHHEPWGDEAQPWLLIRDNDLAGLLSLLPSEGHPPLWYLSLFPFVKLGFPYEAVNWIPGSFSIIAVYILLFRTNAPFILKLILPFSNFFIYIYSVFARSYSLVLLCSMVLVSIYPRRFEKPWLFAICIICLFNTHMLVFPFTLAVVILYLFEAIQLKKLNRSIISSIVVMLIGGLYLLPYLGTSNMAQHFSSKASPDHIETMKKVITGGLLVFGDTTLALVLFLLAILLLVSRTKPLFLLLAGTVGILYILAYHYSTAIIRHYGVLYIVIITTYAIAEEYKEDEWNTLKKIRWKLPVYGAWVCAITAILQMPVAFKNYMYDIEGQYSGSKEAAQFLKDNNLENKIIVAYQSWAGLSVLPYLAKDVQFYNPQCERWNTYYRYDSCFTKEFRYAADYSVKVGYLHFKDKINDIIFVFNFPLEPYLTRYMELLYTNPEESVYGSETFYIYKFKEGLR